MDKGLKTLEQKIFKQTFISKFFAVLIGCLFVTISFVLILRPNHMISGGVNGISVLIESVTGIKLSLLVLVLNLPLLIIGLIMLSKEFIFFTILSTLFTTFYVYVLTGIFPHNFAITKDPFLACVIGGILSGVGNGITFRYGTSTGGFDIIGAIAKKYYNINIGTGLLALNGAVIGASAYIFSIDRALYTLVAYIIAYSLVDKIHLGVGKQKQILIISSKYEEITDMIQHKIARGVTLIDAEGAYKHKKLKLIYCIATPLQLVKIKNFIKALDPHAFVTVCETVEIQGSGFKKIEIQ